MTLEPLWKPGRRLQMILWSAKLGTRLVAIGSGIYVEYHEIFASKTVQFWGVFLGLWLMCVPPALWFDQFRRFTRIGAAVIAAEERIEEGRSTDEPPPPRAERHG